MKKSRLLILLAGLSIFASRGRFHRNRNTRNANPHTCAYSGGYADPGGNAYSGAGCFTYRTWRKYCKAGRYILCHNRREPPYRLQYG